MKTGLWTAFRRLDDVLRQAVSIAPAVYGTDAQADPYRGLYMNWEAVQRLFTRDPGAPLFTDNESLNFAYDVPILQKLAATFGLSAFDLDILLIALAPEVDLRYRRLYAYLQDDVTRKYPTVDLVLNLLCANPEARIVRRMHFAPDAPLIRHQLLHLDKSEEKVPGPLLARSLQVDEQIVGLLLAQPGIDTRLAAFCKWVIPNESLETLPLAEDTRHMLRVLADRDSARRLYFGGRPDVLKRRAAEAFAAQQGLSLLVVDTARILAPLSEFTRMVPLILREARFRRAWVLLEEADLLSAPEYALQRRTLLAALDGNRSRMIVAATPSRLPDADLLSVQFPPPDYHARREMWRVSLKKAGVTAAPDDVDALAAHYRLFSGQIEQAAALAAQQTPTPEIAPVMLFTAARMQFSDALNNLAQKIEPVHTWEEIILPDDALEQLRELCARYLHRHQVMDDWGFERRLSRGKGIAALFAGPSGTGKTMAAEIIAGSLQLDLYRVDLSQVVSKYIGETEKNLRALFDAAENSGAILFFDEADALFGKRTEIRDSHDRYANVEISYLLQQMETYDGVSILATNLRQNIDSAFLRRLAFAVHFPFPDEDSRRLIWKGIWPQAVPLAEDVDLSFMARQFKLSGGNIKNVALAAAFLAAERGGSVTMEHLLHATRRELEKSGRMLTEAELNGSYQQETR